MKSEWQLWAADEARIAAHTCAQVVHFAMALPPMQAEVSGDGSFGYQPEHRRSEVRWIKRKHEEFRPIWDLLERRIQTSNRDSFGFDVSYIHSLQFTSYDASENGHFDWHMDTFYIEPRHCFHRKLTCILQLTAPDQYEGGDLELEASAKPEPAELRKQGAMIVFPAFTRHRVTAITAGVRHCLVAWGEGPPWR